MTIREIAAIRRIAAKFHADKTERAFQAALKRKNRPGLRQIASTLGVGVGTVQASAGSLRRIPRMPLKTAVTRSSRLTGRATRGSPGRPGQARDQTGRDRSGF